MKSQPLPSPIPAKIGKPLMRYMLVLMILLFCVVNVSTQGTVQVDVSNHQPFLGELITYSVSFASTDDLEQAQIQLPEFVGLAQQPGSIMLSTETINGLPNNVMRQDILLYATRVGDLTVEPASVIVPETPFQAGSQSASTPMTLTVASLPIDAPDTFTGAVGQFDMSVNVEKAIIQAGEPNTLSLSIFGSGNFERIVSPPHRLPASWQIFEQTPITSNPDRAVQTKIFSFQFFPNEAGNMTLPAIIFSYFDPTTATYKTLTSTENNFTVEGEFTATNQIAISSQATGNLPLKPMTSQPASVIPPSGFWILWAIPPIFVLLIILVQSIFRPRNQSTRPTKKQSPALKNATAQLTQAQNLSPNEIYGAVEQAILAYIADAYRQKLTSVDQLQSVISGLPVTIQREITACLEQAQSGRYAPVTKQEARQLLKQTYDTLRLIEKERS